MGSCKDGNQLETLSNLAVWLSDVLDHERDKVRVEDRNQLAKHAVRNGEGNVPLHERPADASNDKVVIDFFAAIFVLLHSLIIQFVELCDQSAGVFLFTIEVAIHDIFDLELAVLIVYRADSVKNVTVEVT